MITGKVGRVSVEIMLDTGSSVYLLHHSEAISMNTRQISQGCSSIRLVTASGEPLPIISCVEATINMTDPVILRTDFLYKHHLCLDFTSFPVTVQQNASELNSAQPLWDAVVEVKVK